MLTKAIKMNCISFIILFALNFVYLVGFLKLSEGNKYKEFITLFRFLHNLRKKTQGFVRIMFHIITKVQYIRSVVYDSLQPCRLQHPRLPCPSLTPTAYSNSCPSSRWCHPTISSSVIPFSSWLQSFPASGSFLMSQFFASDGQSVGASVSASILSMNIQDWFPLGWTDWISLQTKGLSRVFSNTAVQKQSILQHSAFFIVKLSHLYMTTGKTIALTRQTFVGKVMSLLFNMLSRLVIAFFPRSKTL